MGISPHFFVKFHNILPRTGGFRNDLPVFSDEISFFWFLPVAIFF